jgi:ABC-2 type transport system permease protein
MGNLEFYMMAPCSRFSILVGMAVGGIFWTTSRAVVGVGLGVWLLRVPLDFARLPEAIGVLALTLVSMYALGMWMASLFLLYGREVWHLANAFQEPVYLASGLYFPVRALGPWVAVSFAVLPLTLGLDALRQVLVPEIANGLLPLGLEIGLLVLSGIAFLCIAAVSWRWLEHRAKATGRLILRFQ